MEPNTTSPVPGSQADADHRVANNLALLSGVIRHRIAELRRDRGTMSVSQVRGILEDLAARIESISKLHRVLARGAEADRLSLVRFVGEVCTWVSASFPPGSVSLSMDFAFDVDVTPDQAMHLGRAVVEMLTNAVKHAHPTGIPVLIHVACRETSRREIVVEIADDGVGLPENFEAAIHGGLGLRMMHSAAAQLGGRMEFEQAGIGLRSRIVMPRRALESTSASVAA